MIPTYNYHDETTKNEKQFLVTVYYPYLDDYSYSATNALKEKYSKIGNDMSIANSMNIANFIKKTTEHTNVFFFLNLSSQKKEIIGTYICSNCDPQEECTSNCHTLIGEILLDNILAGVLDPLSLSSLKRDRCLEFFVNAEQCERMSFKCKYESRMEYFEIEYETGK